ncbi:MAG TPA: zinc-ribbon domain-containing protein [Candidatus Ornithoclostridium excrementipullorum]|nr:zinc-ribbon domain-containing protein [Candidatus Ornithoclostridium excrementipullorum]
MNCKNCGEQLAEGAVFCSKCGTHVSEVTDSAVETTAQEPTRQDAVPPAPETAAAAQAPTQIPEETVSSENVSADVTVEKAAWMPEGLSDPAYAALKVIPHAKKLVKQALKEKRKYS